MQGVTARASTGGISPNGVFLPSGFPDPSISCHFGSRVRLPATTGIVWLAFWATIFFCGVRCLQADRRPLSGFSVSLPSGRRWTRLAEGRDDRQVPLPAYPTACSFGSPIDLDWR